MNSAMTSVFMSYFFRSRLYSGEIFKALNFPIYISLLSIIPLKQLLLNPSSPIKHMKLLSLDMPWNTQKFSLLILEH